MSLHSTKNTAILETGVPKKMLNNISLKPHYFSQNVPLKYIQIESYFQSKQ